MMQIAHVPTGALVGKFMPNPFLAFVAGVLIHFAIDKIPHWWPDKFQHRVIAGVLDYLLAAGFITALYYSNNLTSNMIWGVVGSLTVDIVLVGIPWIFHSKAGRWHEERQPHKVNPWVFVTDFAVIIISVVLILV